ncbi:hypothetical protein GCM10009786_01030 [Leucobacter alluvii]|uniref:Methyltransferase domain-containing protein n=1 Tax=Leucobacter alluvii TaxID=340321 RepID=A0ABP5MTW1_9MICO
MTVITKPDLDWWLKLEPELDWRFATTYADGAPHEYVVAGKTPGLTQDDVARAAHVIRTHGEPMKFYKQTRIYLVTPMGWKHWDMQGAIIDDASVTLINRGRIEHVYGAQNMPRTASGVQSSYDEIATTWDRDHCMNENELHVLTSLIREIFGATLGRTLDVGCGTGVPLDLNLAESVRYVGIDPSTAMLNALVMKHPLLAGVHPLTYAEAERRRVLCGSTYDAVLALGGSASYLAPDEIKQLCARSTRAVLLMHYLPGVSPVTGDLDSEVAEQSLRAASASATLQIQVGRFIASALPGNATVLP